MTQRYDTPADHQNDGHPQTSAPDFPLKIAPGTDLNAAATSEDCGIPADVFNNLPEFLGAACAQLDTTEREVFLVSALVVLSGCLPNVHGHYDGKFYSPHLYGYLLGGYGTGKGAAEYARTLGDAIHRQRLDRAREDKARYDVENAEWKENKMAGEMPVKPKKTRLFLPANSSKSGLIELMEENEGRGIIFETEADTLADAINSDHGNFSDILRKGFHHEAMGLFRRSESESRDIALPQIAVLLTSTPDQYRRLIPSPENGLFSRFIHFHLKPDPEFHNVFDRAKRERPDYFKGMGEGVLSVYNSLQSYQAAPLEFQLRPEHERRFLELFRDWKADFLENVSPGMAGTANRLGLITFRVAMVLTAVRSLWAGDFSTLMICSDEDFANALRLAEVFKRHALRVFWSLPKPAISAEASAFERELLTKSDKVAQARILKQQGLSVRDIAAKISEPRSTVHRWLE